eukprot:scaffold10432_cov130-Isochrysis_galbana.AAC.5
MLVSWRRSVLKYQVRGAPSHPARAPFSYLMLQSIALSLCSLRLSEPQPVPLATGAQSAIGGDWKRQPGPQPQRGAGADVKHVTLRLRFNTYAYASPRG